MNWLKKFVQGFALFNGEVMGKILYYGLLWLLFQGIYTKLTAPTTQQTIKAETVINQAENHKRAFLGVKLWRVGMGIYIE